MAKNVKVDTKISSSRSVGDAIGYTIKGKPHNNNNGKIKKRAVMIRGLNVSDNPYIAKIEMNDTLMKAGIHKNNVHCLREIKSYKFLDYRSKRDRQLGMKMDLEMMQKEHPHCQILAVMHIDGVHHHIHIHNIICAIDPITMKSITHRQTSWTYHLRPITNKVMTQNGFPNQSTNLHSPKKRSRNVIYHIKRSDSWVNKIQQKLDYARLHAINPMNYLQLVKNQGIGIECFKMHTVNGKREIHYYKNPSKSKKIIQHEVTMGKHKGEYVHERKHFSYDIQFNGKKYKIRDKKLGSNFTKHNLLKQFKINHQRMIHPSSKVASNNKLIRSNSKQNQHPKTVSHQQSNSIQPVMIRGKNNISGKNDMGSIKHSLDPSSVDKANKLMKAISFQNTIIPAYHRKYDKKVSKTNLFGKLERSSIIIPAVHLKHMPFIKLPHLPKMPLLLFLKDSNNDEVKQAIINRINIDNMDKYRQQYSDYISAKDAVLEAKQFDYDINKEIIAKHRGINRQ